MSIRLRLSLLYSGILALTLVVVGYALYTVQSQYTLNWLKQDMVISGNTLSQSMLQNFLGPQPSAPNGQANNGNPPPNGTPPPANATLPPGSTPPPVGTPPPVLTLTYDETFQRQSQQEIVRVLDPDGRTMASPVGSSDISLPLSQDGLQAVRRQQDWWSTEVVSGTRLLIYSHPIVFQGRVTSILQIARALTERDQSLQSLGRTLVIATLIAILATFGISWLLAREALRPIRQISQTAQSIGSERDFTRRVAYTGPQDEVGQLALTFNAMLAQLAEAYQKVAHALEMQRDFVANVSHELRTPLTTLRGDLGLLNHTPALPETDQADILKDMVEESDRLIRLVNSLLVLARADAGQNLARDRVVIRPVMEETCRQARLLAPERDIRLDAPGDLAVTGSRDALKQILLIVLDNALKHTGGAVSLSAQASGAQVTLRIQDEGAGIPPEQLAHVFDRFYRGGDRAAPGVGLGLSIAKSLVESQGGTITIESKVGQGSAVVISLLSNG